jgi:predicted nuclease of predicted toxin-antitoxin system
VRIWIDAQLSPSLAAWIESELGHEARSLSALGMQQASDREVFLAARAECAVVMSKDSDFVRLLDELGPPPALIWITCGNTSNRVMRRVLAEQLPRAVQLLEDGQRLVEIRG